MAIRTSYIKCKRADKTSTFSGNVTIDKNLTISGNLTFGDATTDVLTVTGYIDVGASTTGTTAAVDIAQAGTGKSLRIDQNNTGDAGIAFEIDDEATGNAEGVKIASKRTGIMVLVDSEANANPVVEIQNAGTGKALLLDLNATGDTGIGLEIDDEATGNSNLLVDIKSARTGALAKITAEGAATNVLELEAADGSTGTGLLIDHNETDGAATGIHVDIASTSTDSAFIMQVTGGATNAGAVITSGVATDCAIDNVKRVFTVKVGTESTVYYVPLLDTYT